MAACIRGAQGEQFTHPLSLQLLLRPAHTGTPPVPNYASLGWTGGSPADVNWYSHYFSDAAAISPLLAPNVCSTLGFYSRVKDRSREMAPGLSRQGLNNRLHSG